jgi:hypothetical protein
VPEKREPGLAVGLFRGLQDLQIGEEILKADKSIAAGFPDGGQEVSRVEGLREARKGAPNQAVPELAISSFRWVRA